MRKRDQVKKLFEQAIGSLEQFDVEKFGNTLSEGVTADISMLGKKTVGKEALTSGLKLRGEFNTSRWWISNICVRTAEDFAVMSAYLTIMIGKKEKGFLHSVEWGGKTVVRLKRESGSYKITDIRYDLDWMNGNTAFLEQFVLIDYTSHYDAGRCISPADAPWKQIPENDEALSDEEQIRETMSIYCFAVDNHDMESLRLAETEDIYWLWDAPFDSFVVAKDIESHVRYFQDPKNYVVRRQHPVRVVDVKTTGSEAEMTVYLLRKNHVRSSELNITNMDTQYYNSVYKNRLRRENGIWKLCDMRYKYYELPQKNGFLHRHYVDEKEYTV